MPAPGTAGKRALLRANQRPAPGAALAQLVEHRIRNAGVTGSSPVSGTIPLRSNFAEPLRKGLPRGSGMGPLWGGFVKQPGVGGDLLWQPDGVPCG